MSAKEIQNLRRKFISIAMASFALVILLVGALINAANYYVTQREIRWSLEQLTELQDSIEESLADTHPFHDAPSLSEVFSPAFRNNTFYILSYDAEGRECSLYASKGNPYKKSLIRENAAEIMAEEKEEGRFGMYYYRRTADDEGNSLLVIMDCSYVVFTRIRLLYASIAVGAFSVLASLLLVIRFSGKMIRPEIESSRRQIQFLTNVSHELKTPLAVIRSNAEMEELTGGENEWTRSTIRQVDRMSGLIRNLVMITKTREISEDASTAVINASNVVSQTAAEYSAMAESQEKTLQERIEPEIEITADESRLRQLAVILIDNAVKYCDQGGEIIVSLERLKRGKNRIRLTVSNTYAEGSNIDCSRFFDRFYREDASHNIDTGGYGIGLSIAGSICELFGGSIKAQWKSGTVFFICEIC